MRPIRHLARLLLLLLLFTTLPVAARPALWVIHHGPATVYLFGTVHLLPGDTAWRSPSLEQALKASDRLYLEVTDDNPMQVQALVLRYGMDFNQKLSDLLSPADNKRLAAAARAAGLPGGTTALQPMKPWLAALTLTVAPLVKAGMNPKMGVDKQIKAQMVAAGKPVLGLETSATQIQLLASMSQADQLDFLRSTLRDFGKAREQLAQLVSLWKTGDVKGIASKVDAAMRKESPSLYRTLIVHRNAHWAATITGLLDTPGTTFIAVGAAHLAGPDSVQALLARKGIHAQRL